jgi:hypothetical protein
MHHAALGNNVARVALGRDGLTVGGLAVLDVVGLGRGRQEAEGARDEDQVVGRGRAVHGALGVGRQVNVVHVETAGKDDAHARDLVEGQDAAAERSR